MLPKTLASCETCPLGRGSSIGKMVGLVPPSGSGANGVLVVAEAAGGDEEILGEGLVGVAGRQFNRLIARAGYPRDQFRLANVLQCRPPKNELSGMWYEHEAIASCAPNLDLEIARTKPKIIIALGNIAMRRLTGMEGIRRYRGRPLEGPNGIWVMPTFHPSFLLPRQGQDDGVRNPARYTGAVILDIKRAFHIKDHGFTRSEGRYLLDPSPDKFYQFILEYEAALKLDPFGTFLSWDIETPWKLAEGDEEELELKEAVQDNGIIRISFSFKPGYAASVPWTPAYLPGIRRLLESQGAKVTWNGWHFDEPTIRRNGLTINGVSHDGMWAWHLYQPDLDMGLEFVSSFATDLLPWKHLNSSDPVLYSAIDPDAALQNFLYTKAKLEKHGQWDLWMRHGVAMEPIWREAGNNGVHINVGEQSALREVLTRDIDAKTEEAQQYVPDSVRPRHRFKTKRTVEAGRTEGRRFEDVVVRGEKKFCSHCGLETSNKSEHLKGGKKNNPCAAAGASLLKRETDVVEWDEVLPFNPNSTDQLRAYILHSGHKLGRDPKNKSRVVSDAKHIKKLVREHGEKFPLYQLVLDVHKMSKTRSTYLPVPDEHHKIYTVYTNAPGTWRTSSRAPSEHGANTQNWGKREENKWAKLARRTVVAKPGFVFVSADSKAVEALMTGWFMRDLNFMRLSAKGVYAWLLCRAHGVEFTDANAAKLKKEDDKGYRKKKQTTLGTLYGMDAPMLFETYPEDFASIDDAKAEQNFLFTALPKLKEFQTEFRVRAHKETFLESPWGYRRYFYDVFVWKKNRWGVWKKAEGQGADKAVAQLPQNSNSAFQRDNILLLEQTWLRDYKPAILFTHDQLLYEVPEERALEAADLLEQVMTRPIAEMNSLRVGIEVEMGKNWGDYDKEENPDGMKLLRAVMIEPTEEMLPFGQKEIAA